MIIVSTMFFEARIRPQSGKPTTDKHVVSKQAARLSMFNPKKKDCVVKKYMCDLC